MATRIMHFGIDECRRITVLRSAGYSVKFCFSIPDLDSALQSPEKPDAITVSDAPAPDCHDAAILVHGQCSAPIILFQHAVYAPDESEFDLVIPSYTPPGLWLEKIAASIQLTQALSMDAAFIRQESAALLKELRRKDRRNSQISVHSRSLAQSGVFLVYGILNFGVYSSRVTPISRDICFGHCHGSQDSSLRSG